MKFDQVTPCLLIVYNRHGQSAARRPHAARQTFFAALESKGAQILCKINPKKHHVWRKFWLFKPKKDIFEEHFWNLLGFSQICREHFKKFCPPLPLEWTCGPQNIKKYWKWPVSKKVWPPLVYNTLWLKVINDLKKNFKLFFQTQVCTSLAPNVENCLLSAITEKAAIKNSWNLFYLILWFFLVLGILMQIQKYNNDRWTTSVGLILIGLSVNKEFILLDSNLPN